MTVNPGGGLEKAEVGYTYDFDNQLTELTLDAPGRRQLAQFVYNGDGLRVEKTVTGNITIGGSQQYYSVRKKYLLDGVDVLLEKQVFGEGEAEEEIVTSLYVPGIMLATVTGENQWVVRYFLHDAFGNVIALTDENQQITAVYQYDAFGNPLVSPETEVVSLASSPVPTGVLHNPYRWCGAWGYYWDEDTGLYLLGLRWYESFTGRFLTRDPLGFASGDSNLYRYVRNNPVNEVDPWGLWDIEVGFYIVKLRIGKNQGRWNVRASLGLGIGGFVSVDPINKEPSKADAGLASEVALEIQGTVKSIIADIDLGASVLTRGDKTDNYVTAAKGTASGNVLKIFNVGGSGELGITGNIQQGSLERHSDIYPEFNIGLGAMIFGGVAAEIAWGKHVPLTATGVLLQRPQPSVGSQGTHSNTPLRAGDGYP